MEKQMDSEPLRLWDLHPIGAHKDLLGQSQAVNLLKQKLNVD